MSQRTIRYSTDGFTDCTDAEGQKITAFSIRTTDGTDEAYSSKRAEAKGTSMSEELIRFSMVSYEVAGPSVSDPDGNTITTSKTIVATQPFEQFDKWSTKIRNFVVAAWKRISTPNEEEISNFFASATEIA